MRHHIAAAMLLCLAGPLLTAQPAVHADVLAPPADFAAGQHDISAVGTGPATTAALVALGSFAIVPGESSVKFFVPDTRGGFTGHTTQVTGRVTALRRGDGTYTAQVTAAVAARTLTTDNATRDASMHSTFLRTGPYPTITFVGAVTAGSRATAPSFSASAQGRLTIRNVTRPQTFPVTVAVRGHAYVVDATATVRMADYGIPYPRAFIFVARDPVTVTLHVVARQPAAGAPRPARAY